MSQITDTTATITIKGHTAQWWYKADTGPDATCQGPVAANTGSEDLTGLTAGNSYTYTAYSNSGCTTTIVSASMFTTSAVSVSNLGETYSNSNCFVGNLGGGYQRCGAGFSTGNTANGYTLDSVTASFNTSVGNPAALTVALHAASGNKPASTAIENATFSGDVSPSAAGEYTYDCSGVGCQLSANTTYYVVVQTTNAGSGNYYFWKTTSSNDETKSPSTNVWSISDDYHVGGGGGGNFGGVVEAAALFKVAATVYVPPPATLTASDISGTGATLTVANHSGAWYYRGISGTSASTTCVTVSSGTTATLSSLTADNLYGYTAYSGASCTGTEIGTDYFSTNDYDVGNLGEGAASGSCLVGYSAGSRKCAMPFTTGDRSGGYTLKSITAEFNAKQEITGTLGNIIVAIHAEDTVNSANPAATAKVTLDGNNPNTAGLYSYTCSGSDCSLSKETKYFIVMSTADTDGVKFYQMKLTTSDAEAVHPSGNEWSIENVGREKNGSAAWVDLASSQTGLLHIAADD